ncbi:MAG: hypothetical protein AAGK17_03315 [Pseudomonadota bacterium]
MTDAPLPDPKAEEHAGKRFILINAMRLASLAVLMIGIAGAQNAVDMPYAMSVLLALGGFLGFFFGPYYLAKHYKSQDDKGQK